MADYGITEYGFVRKPFQTIYTDTVTSFKNRLGQDFDVSDGSVNQQFIGTFCDALDVTWQALQGVYSSQTVQGAEGIYLDDLLSQQGVFRQGQTAGGGQVLVESNLALVPLGTVLTSTSTVAALNNVTYDVVSPVTIDGFGSTFTLAASQLANTQIYYIVIYNTDSPTTNVFTWTTGVSDSDKDNMLLALAGFINTNVAGLNFPAYVDTTARKMCCGYNPNNGLPSPLPASKLYVNSTVGNIGNIIEVKARKKGYYPLPTAGVTSLSPTFTGYVGVSNWEDFSSGTETQTDAEYRIAYQQTEVGSAANTEDSIRSSILNLEGTTACVVWENPKPVYVFDRYDNLVCNPSTYHVVVEGGDNTEIASTIAAKMPVGVGQTGNTAVEVDGTTVLFSKATKNSFAVKLKYQMKDGSAINEVVRQTLIDTFIELADGLIIGDEIIAEQFKSAAYSVLPYTKVKSITVEIKNITNIGSSYVTTSLYSAYNQRPYLTSSNIFFERLPA